MRAAIASYSFTDPKIRAAAEAFASRYTAESRQTGLGHSLGLEAEARAVERAVSDAVKDGARTKDLGGSLSTVAAADEVLSRLARETTAA